jgi:hypothetical protein
LRIATCVRLVTNRKAPARRGRVQQIDASSFWVPMRRSRGDKRREILDLVRQFIHEGRNVSRIRSATPHKKPTISPWFIGLPLPGRR